MIQPRIVGFIPQVGLPILKVVFFAEETEWLYVKVHLLNGGGDIIKGKFPATPEGYREALELANALLKEGGNERTGILPALAP